MLANKIFKYVLEDDNVLTTRKVLLQDHKSLLNKLEDEKNFIAKIRRLFIEDKIDHEDFLSLKKEQCEKIGSYHERLNKLEEKIKTNEINSLQKIVFNGSDILRCYKNQEIEGKRYILSLFSPSSINPSNRILAPIEVNPAIALIIIKENNSTVIEFVPTDTFKKSVQFLYRASKSFSTKKVSINRVIDMLKRNGIQTNEDQAKVILEFLYLIGSIYCLKEQYLISQP